MGYPLLDVPYLNCCQGSGSEPSHTKKEKSDVIGMCRTGLSTSSGILRYFFPVSESIPTTGFPSDLYSFAQSPFRVWSMAIDIDELLNRPYTYTHDALWEQWSRWGLLFVCVLINTFTLGLVPLFSGYRYRIYEGRIEPPGVDRWARLFVDGWKLNIIWIVYFIIPLIIITLIIGIIVFAVASPIITILNEAVDPEVIISKILLTAGLFLIALIFILIVLYSVLVLLHTIAKVRVARTGILMDAFSLRAILSHIKNIGWINYGVLIAIIWIISITLGFVVAVFTTIPAIGVLIAFFVAPPLEIFKARYVTLMYDRGLEHEAPVEAG
jgi:hypothetical protein